MKLLGFEILRKKAAPPTGLSSVNSRSSWWNWGGPILESFSGAWQKNVVIDSETSLLAFSAVFSCVTGIASDVAKMRIKLDIERDGIWTEIVPPQQSPWLPVLRKPNHYQNRIKFVEQWIVSKLLHGNAYVLKERDGRGIVSAMYVLDPSRVKPLVADNGDVYYELQADYLSGVKDIVTVPASEIIHDMMVGLWHPLVGVSPLYACGLSATMGNRIQSSSTKLFGNAAIPSGILTAPGAIDNETAARLKTKWEENYGGANVGRTAVLGDGLKFEVMTMPADHAQLIEQLEWTVEDVARTFHYPQYKLGGPLPPYSSGPETLTLMYYTDCLQPLIESLEVCLDEGLSLPENYGTEMDLDNLMRMDTKSLFDANNLMVIGGWGAPNEARFKANYAPVTGGDSPMIQQQNYSLAAIAKRDAQPDPFKTAQPIQPQLPPAPEKPALPPAKQFDFEDLEHCETELRKELILEQA